MLAGRSLRAPTRNGSQDPRASSRPLHLDSQQTAMSEIGDSPFEKGQDVWVIQADGSQRAAEYVGVGETSAWFGGPPKVIVVYPDTRSGEAVEVDRVIPR